MKSLLFGMFFSVLFFATTGCGDDEPDCVQADYIGTYNSTGGSCSDPSVSVLGAKYTITPGSASDEIKIADEDGITYTTKIDGCKIEKIEQDLGVLKTTIEGSLEGNVITFNTKLTSGGNTVTCTFIGTK